MLAGRERESRKKAGYCTLKDSNREKNQNCFQYREN